MFCLLYLKNQSESFSVYSQIYEGLIIDKGAYLHILACFPLNWDVGLKLEENRLLVLHCGGSEGPGFSYREQSQSHLN